MTLKDMLDGIHKWVCKYLGWHNPVGRVGFDGCSFTSRCRYCGKHILMDSQGNWF